MTTASRLGELKRQRPEWTPWLSVIEQVLDELEGPSSAIWTASVPDSADAARHASVPRLIGAHIALPTTPAQRFVERLFRTASHGGTSEMASLADAIPAREDLGPLFRASLCHDHEGLAEMAARYGADVAAFQAVAALAAVPFLQACNGRWSSSIPQGWVEEYCWICGTWPAFVEVRGIERSRHYRCGRCGSGWHAEGLSCPYCSNTDHRELLSLVPDVPGAAATIEACKRCLGYVKVFNRLQGCSSSAVIVEDLSSVALDIAALEQGYRRPASVGYQLDVTVIEAEKPRGFLVWNS